MEYERDFQALIELNASLITREEGLSIAYTNQLEYNVDYYDSKNYMSIMIENYARAELIRISQEHMDLALDKLVGMESALNSAF